MPWLAMDHGESVALSNIGVSCLPLLHSRERGDTSIRLKRRVDLQLAGLKKFVRAEQVEILDRRTFTLGANPSLFMKVSLP